MHDCLNGNGRPRHRVGARHREAIAERFADAGSAVATNDIDSDAPAATASAAAPADEREE